MKKLALFVCLLVVTVAAQAQFEKGKWILNPSITGLEFSHDTGTDKTSFGLEAREVLSCSTMWLCWCMPEQPGTPEGLTLMSIRWV